MSALKAIDSTDNSLVATAQERVRHRLPALRRVKGWSGATLAEAMRLYGIKWDHTTVSRIEAGSRGISLNEGVGLAELFGITVDALTGQAPLVLHELVG